MTGLATAGEAVAAATAALTEAGCDTPHLDAELLIADAMGVDRAMLVADPRRRLESEQVQLVAGRIERRARREPVAYILGRRGFRYLELLVDRRVLIPRADTELLVEVAAAIAPQGARVHDVGTGSGAVALALKHERPDLTVSASDASPAALEVARANTGRLGLDVDLVLHRGLPPGAYDLVVANLPYVRADEWPGFAPEILLYEPPESMLAGADGLREMRALASEAPAGALLALEHSPDQGPGVRGLLRAAHTHRDLAGRERVTVGEAP